jgi:TRAP transporter TAXI family solute receptor
MGFGAPARALDLLLGTGPSGTFSHFAGRSICRVVNSQAGDLDCTVVPASGDVDNLTNLRGGSLDLALVDARMLHDAVNHRGDFEFLDIRYDHLKSLIPVYNQAITIVARRDAGITSLGALKGKRINAGLPESPQRRAVAAIMAAKGWTEKDFGVVQALSPSHAQDRMAFCHGETQVLFHVGVHPDASVRQILELCSAELVNLEKDVQVLVDHHEAFRKIRIDAGLYPSQPKAVTTFGTRVVLAASEDLDEETAAAVVNAIKTGRHRLQSAHPALLADGVGSR